MTHIQKLHLNNFNKYFSIASINCPVTEAAMKSAEITENIACGFAEFISNHRLDFQPSTLGRFIGLDMKSYTAKELFKEYLKTKENDTPKFTN